MEPLRPGQLVVAVYGDNWCGALGPDGPGYCTRTSSKARSGSTSVITAVAALAGVAERLAGSGAQHAVARAAARPGAVCAERSQHELPGRSRRLQG